MLIKNTGKLAGLTIFISGASRGLGREFALKFAKDKPNIVIVGKNAPPKLKGTIHTVAEEVEAAGGKALACLVDIQDESQIQEGVRQTVEKFGGIDILINNASAISLTKSRATDTLRYDLMQNVNARGTFLMTKTCLPYLRKGKNPHILNLAPPINLKPHVFGKHVAYTISKYNVSLFALGWMEEFRKYGIGVNCLWPSTAICTPAIEMLVGGRKDLENMTRNPKIMSDAAYSILSRDSSSTTGNFFVDECVLRSEGITDFSPYLFRQDASPMRDYFLDKIKSVHWSQYTITDPTGSTSADSSKSSSAASNDGGEVMKLINKLFELVTPKLVKETNGVIVLDIKGKDEGIYYLDLKNGNGAVGMGMPSGGADCTITLSGDDFLQIGSGKMTPTSAFMMGKLKIKGSASNATVLENLFKKSKK